MDQNGHGPSRKKGGANKKGPHRVVIPSPENINDSSSPFDKIWWRLLNAPFSRNDASRTSTDRNIASSQDTRHNCEGNEASSPNINTFDLADVINSMTVSPEELCQQETECGLNLLHIASYQANDRKLEIFLDHFKDYVDVNKCSSKSGVTALHIAAQRNFSSGLKILLRLPGANVDMKDNEGFTPLYFAALFKNTKAVKTLIEEGAALNTMLPSKGYAYELCTLAYVLRKTPYAEEAILKRLDNSIKFDEGKGKLIFDLTDWTMEGDGSLGLLFVFAKEERKVKNERDSDLIEHPLVQQMLEESWNYRAHCVYIPVLLFKFAFTILMTMIYNYDNVPPEVMLMLVLLSFIDMIRKIMALAAFATGLTASYWIKNKWKTAKQIFGFQNLCQLTCFGGAILLGFGDPEAKLVKAIVPALFLASWFDLVVVIGDFRYFQQRFGLYYYMYYIVVMHFVRILCAFILFLAGFAICFCMYFKDSDESFNPIAENVNATQLENKQNTKFEILGKLWYMAMAKIFVMFVGELEYSDFIKGIIGQEDKSFDESIMIPVACVIIFVVAVPIVLQSLLIGLVVNDIKEINSKAIAYKLKNEAHTLEYLTSVYKSIERIGCSLKSPRELRDQEEGAQSSNKVHQPIVQEDFEIDDESLPDYLHKAFDIASAALQKQNL